jgi:prepilin-type N-terminal cleavage/methylation domain-containing protein
MNRKILGFTLIEVLVVISIIAVLSAVIYANFGEARESARDKIRKTSLKEVALALEVYKSQKGEYPPNCASGPDAQKWAGPGPLPSWGVSCEDDDYIDGLVPDFIEELPTDPSQESINGVGFIYKVSPQGDRYKLMAHQSVEFALVKDFNDEFARCPSATSGSPCASVPATTYAVYSRGAEDW